MSPHKYGPTTVELAQQWATCERCGVTRIRRTAYSHHWTEWKAPDGQFLVARPDCAARPSPLPASDPSTPEGA
jgi:hypothetical protein